MFLDEIGDIPVSVQTKLLRALQEGEIKPVGEAKAKKVDVQIVSSTNQDLEEKIRHRSFREDLLYRLNVVTLRTPGLRERREDIPLLATHFARIACRELDMPMKRFSEAALEVFMAWEWPGNIRQLQNVVRQAGIFSPEEVIRCEDLMRIHTGVVGVGTRRHRGTKNAAVPVASYKDAKARVLQGFTFHYVKDLLEKTGAMCPARPN